MFEKLCVLFTKIENQKITNDKNGEKKKKRKN